MKFYLLITLFLSGIMLFFPFLSLSNIFTEKVVNEAPDTTVVITDSTGKIKTETDLKEYIIGSVAAEMPASFETEALKAQAVAAYTYQKYLKENGTTEIIDGSIHQEYKTNEELRVLWGEDYESYKAKITSAVETVYGEYLTYEGETIPALYHGISPGTTESAEVIFGKNIPCLSSVTAPGDKLSPKYSEEVSFTKKEAESKLRENGVEISGNGEKIFNIESTTDNNYPTKINIGAKSFNGKDIREYFDLGSPYFTVKENESKIIFTVYGRGHGVGMSQYSADYMARQGFSYKDILTHFYKGAKIAK